MTFAVNLSQNIIEGSSTISNTLTFACGQVKQLDVSVADATTDEEHVMAIDISTLLVFYMVASVAMTVETNSGSAAQETFTLVANEPVAAHGAAAIALFAGDVTSLFVTNASGTAGTLKILAGVNV